MYVWFVGSLIHDVEGRELGEERCGNFCQHVLKLWCDTCSN